MDPHQMPETPEMAPLHVEERQHYSLSWMTKLLTIFLGESPATLCGKTASSCLCSTSSAKNFNADHHMARMW